MQNELLNSTGLDGVTDWDSTLGVLSTDDTVVGRDGVIVNVATRLAATAGQKVDLATSTVLVAQGERIEAFIHYGCAGGRVALELEIVDGTGGGSPVGKKQILPVRPSLKTPRRGIPADFNIAYARLRAPESGHARLKVVATAFGGDVAAYAMRPFLDVGNLPAARQFWAAGQHSNADLSLPAWPSILRGPSGNYQAEPLGRRKAFAGDSMVPAYRQLSNTTRWIGRGSYRLDTRARDELEAFYQETSGAFYFVRPDTFQLCRARWTDKEPTDSGLGAERSTEVELLLEVA